MSKSNSTASSSIATRIKRAKFKPCTIPRYPQGSIGFLKSDLREYNKHLFNIFSAEAKVDSKPPKFPAEKYLKLSNLQTAQGVLRDTYRQNKYLVQQINVINRHGGKLNTVNEYANNTTTKWALKKLELDKINKENLTYYNRIVNAQAIYTRKDHSQHWAHMLKKMAYFAKYPLILGMPKSKEDEIKECPSISLNIGKLPLKKKNPRPRCFFDFQFETGLHLGRIVFELYNDVVPKTVENFLWLVHGTESKDLTYKHNCINKLYLGKYCTLAANHYGQKDTSLFGDEFKPENYKLLHTRPGVLSMICSGNKVKSEFCLTFGYQPELNGKNVVFGKLVNGASVLQRINGLGTKHGKPLTEVVVGNCQEIVKTPKKKKCLKARGTNEEPQNMTYLYTVNVKYKIKSLGRKYMLFLYDKSDICLIWCPRIMKLE